MFNIGTGEMIMIAVVALLVLGPQRLPELARGIGKFIREFRRQTDDVRNVVEREFYKMDQDVMNPAPPQIQAAADAVAQPPAIAPSLPLEEPQPPPVVDESDPGHPDYHREEKPPEPEPEAAPTDPTQKAS